MASHQLFYFALTFIIIHEMDAVRCKEWRMFPGLSSLKEPLAFRIFMFAHIPLFLALLWALTTPEDLSTIIICLDIFFILHLALHVAFLWHKNNEFKDWISWTLIIGAGIFGILDIFVGNS